MFVEWRKSTVLKVILKEYRIYILYLFLLCISVNRLKEETKALINIPSDDSDIVRIEGDPQGVAQVKTILLEMVHKMVRFNQ